MSLLRELAENADPNKFIITWRAYGDAKATMPFNTRKAALKHIERLIEPGKEYNVNIRLHEVNVETGGEPICR